MNRIVIVSGACGVGKSEALRSMRGTLAGLVADTAVLETDHFYMIIDPLWELPYEGAERYHELSGFLVQEVARRLTRNGFDWVAIGSNGLYEESHVREFVSPFLSDGIHVHHVTLDPGLGALQQRMEHRRSVSGNLVDEIKTPDWLSSQLSWFRDRYGPWTSVINNSALTPSQTAKAIYEEVEDGKGRLE